MDVLLVAVKKDKILNYTNVLSLAGKAPAVVDIDAFALQNCYEYNYEPAPNSTVALLNLGASVMNINIVKGSTPLFTRDVSVGGHQYTDSLQKELDLSFDDAEALKLGRRSAPSAKTRSCRSCSRSPKSSFWKSKRRSTSSAQPPRASTSSGSTLLVDRRRCRA